MSLIDRAAKATHDALEQYANCYDAQQDEKVLNAASWIWAPVVQNFIYGLTQIERALLDPDQPGETQRGADALQIIDALKHQAVAAVTDDPSTPVTVEALVARGVPEIEASTAMAHYGDDSPLGRTFTALIDTLTFRGGR